MDFETRLCLLFDWMTVQIWYEDDYNKFSVNLCLCFARMRNSHSVCQIKPHWQIMDLHVVHLDVDFI